MPENAPVAEKPPVSIWKRALFGLAVVVAAAVVVGLVRGRYSATSARELSAAVEELDEADPGWTLDGIEAARRAVADKDNSALAVMEAVKRLPRNWPPQQVYDQLADLPPAELLDAERLALLDKELAALTDALTDARRLADLPHGRHRLVHAENPLATLLNDQQESRRAAQLLGYDVLRLSSRGQTDAALRGCRAMFNAGRSLGDEPFMISQLIRVAVVAMALSHAERTLSLGEASDAELAELAKLLALEERHPAMRISLRGERAMLHKVFQGMANRSYSAKEVAAMLNGGGSAFASDWRLRWFGLSRSQVEASHAQTLRMLTRFIEAAQLPTEQQIAQERKLDAEVKALPAEAILTRLLLPAVTKLNEAYRRTLAQVRVMQAVVAVERHRLKAKAWPDKLPLALLDPYDGKPLRYKRLADGVLVYSVGPDGTDDGGNVDPKRLIGTGVDIGYRLWDVTARRQPAKPRPRPPAGDVPAPGGAG